MPGRLVALGLGVALIAPATAQHPPRHPNNGSGVVSLDLTTGKTDATPLAESQIHGDEAFSPLTPPQTLEGTYQGLDASGRVATVKTDGGQEIKVGIPPDVVVSRGGSESSVAEIKPGDHFYATVVTANGNRALRIVSKPPDNPWLSIIGIPLLLLIALVIWLTGRRRGEVITMRKAEPKKA